MFKNYFKIAIRNLWKNKGFTFINIAGLAIGLSCFILITLYVIDELSYDRFYPNAERIYRVDADIKFGGNQLSLCTNSDPMGATLKKITRRLKNLHGYIPAKEVSWLEKETNISLKKILFTLIPLSLIYFLRRFYPAIQKLLYMSPIP